jgi:hypothetical protein
MEAKQHGKHVSKGRVVALTAACAAAAVVTVVGIKRYAGRPSGDDVRIVTQTELKALVVSSSRDETWRYYGSAGGFHYCERRLNQIIIPGPATRYRVVEREMAIPRTFKFDEWNRGASRIIFARVDEGVGKIVDPEWLEPPGGFVE